MNQKEEFLNKVISVPVKDLIKLALAASITTLLYEQATGASADTCQQFVIGLAKKKLQNVIFTALVFHLGK